MFTCGRATIPEPVGWILASLREPCCTGSFEDGPTGCTCWEPVYDREQTQPTGTWKIDARPALVTRAAMCDDCAYRPDSPERSGDPRYAHEATDGGIPDVPAGGTFFCHQGIRKPTAWRHPAGITVEADVDHYSPPIIDGIPYKADGTPADRCAGWAAHDRAVYAAKDNQ